MKIQTHERHSAKVKFTCIYDNRWAAFSGHGKDPGGRRIIFPQGFTPKEGEGYVVILEETIRHFVYNEETFTVCMAHLQNAADVADVIKAKQAARQPFGTSLENAFAALG